MADVSVFGLGKVGVTLASGLASVGHRVVGVDIDRQLVDALNARTYQTPEPGVSERCARLLPDQFRATTDARDAVCTSEITFVIVPTPSNVLGGFSARYVLAACRQVGETLRVKSGRHTVAVVSTVLPGSSDRLIIPELERASGRQIGDGLGYCYNPAFIALGEVAKGFEEPDYLLIGEADRDSGDLVLDVHRSMIRGQRPVARMSPVEAEITKVASNTHETMRVSFANMLLSVCSEIPGADVDRVTEALAHRMGKRFFRGAVPYGGPCWPRDNQALAAFMDAIGVPSRIPRTIDLFNREHGRYVLRKVLGLALPGARVGILGLAYKPGTPVIDESFGVALALSLTDSQREVIVWDPLAMNEARRALGDRVAYATDAEHCLREASLIVAVNALREFQEIDWAAASHATVVDCWRCLPRSAAAAARQYVALGRGPSGRVDEWLGDTLGPDVDLLAQ